MKTTLEVPDSLYRQIKARAALKGQTIKAFFLEAIRAKLTADRPTDPSVATDDRPAEVGWKAVFGHADKEEIAELQRIIDEEFERIDPEGWD
jgi:hypothetical protein